MHQQVAAKDDQRRKILHIDVTTDLAIVLDVEPYEEHVGPRLRDTLVRFAKLRARIAPCGAKRNDDAVALVPRSGDRLQIVVAGGKHCHECGHEPSKRNDATYQLDEPQSIASRSSRPSVRYRRSAKKEQAMNNRPRKFYGWGYADEALSVAEVEIMERRLAERFGVSHWEVTPPPRPEEFQLPASRIDSVPTRLEPLISTQHLDRLEHSYGQMFVDVARMFERRCPNPPDAVAKPRRERDVADILDWCSAIGAVAIPYGGGTSMVGGIEPPPRAGK